MPIYEQTYRRYEARGPIRVVRFWPITREALRLVLVKRAFLVLLALAWAPFLVRVIQIYVVTRFPEANRVLPIDGRLFGEFLGQQLTFALFITIFGGAGLIANDLRTGAILVYLSRPLTRKDYVLGKLSALLALNLSVTLVPGVLLYGIGLALAPDHFLKWDLAWIFPAVIAQALLMSLILSLVALAVSSLSKSARVAGVAFVGLLLGLDIVRNVLRAIYHQPEAALISLTANLRTVGNALFGIQDRALTLHAAYPSVVLVLVVIGCLAILRQRVRAVEIVR
jgi:ABC-2 type transport system permease protein